MRQLCLASALALLVATSPLASAPPKPPTYPPVSLEITVDDASCGICSDSLGPYVDGEGGVKAVIDKYGNLIFDLPGPRELTYNYGAAPPAPPGPPDATRHYVSTIGGAKAFQAMDEAILESQSVTSCPHYDNANSVQIRHAFQRDCLGGGNLSGTSALAVQRLTVDQWTVETQSSADHRALVFGITIKGRAQVTPYGQIPLPFKMFLMRK